MSTETAPFAHWSNKKINRETEIFVDLLSGLWYDAYRRISVLSLFYFINLGADRCLVCLAVFKTVVRSSKLLRWVRFPHVPAIFT